jgi:hypothetical protein
MLVLDEITSGTFGQRVHDFPSQDIAVLNDPSKGVALELC